MPLATLPRKDKLELYALLCEKERRLCADYPFFFRRAWITLEPSTPLQWNWHLSVICSELQRQAERIGNGEPKKYDIIINVPPRSSKSTMVSRALPAWVWTRFPAQKFVTASYSADLALEHAVQCRRLIQSPWYQELWGGAYELTGDQNVKSFFENDKAGFRISTSVGGTATGRGGDWFIIDDPLSAEQAESEVYRKGAVDWLTQTVWTRLNDQRTGVRVVIMQRLHEEDLTGWLLANQPGKWKLFCFPAEDGENVSPKECRKLYVNGMLFPTRLGRDVLSDMRASMGEYSYAGQMLQRPSPPEGGIFKRQWWRFWKPRGMELPSVQVKVGDQVHTCIVEDLPGEFDDTVCSWDCTFKDLKDNDYVVGTVWSCVGAKQYLRDQDRDRMDFPTTLKRIKALRTNYTETSCVLIEDAANGPAVIQTLSQEISGLIAVKPQGSKQARAMPLSRKCEAGQIYLPHPVIAPWVNAFIEEFAAFPTGSYDDRVDSSGQASNHLQGQKRVWPDFVHKKVVRPFRIDWKDLSEDSTLIISQWTEKNLVTSILLGIWNARNMRLWLFDELVLGSPLPEVVRASVMVLVQKETQGLVKDLSKFEWYGNEVLFHEDTALPGGDSREAYSRYGINLRENQAYNEIGSIMLVARLLMFGAVAVRDRCTESARQMAAWAVDGKAPGPGHGLARGLCNMASILWESGKMKRHEKRLLPYSKEKERVLRSMDDADRAGRLGDWLRHQEIDPRSKHGWMM